MKTIAMTVGVLLLGATAAAGEQAPGHQHPQSTAPAAAPAAPAGKCAMMAAGGAMAESPKMLQMRGEMMKAMGEMMIRHGKMMETPPPTR